MLSSFKNIEKVIMLIVCMGLCGSAFSGDIVSFDNKKVVSNRTLKQAKEIDDKTKQLEAESLKKREEWGKRRFGAEKWAAIKKQIAEAEAFAGEVLGGRQNETFGEYWVRKKSTNSKEAQELYIKGQQFGATNKPRTWAYSYRKAMPKLYEKSETVVFNFGNQLKEKLLLKARAYKEAANKIEQFEDEKLKEINHSTINVYLSYLAGVLMQMKDGVSVEHYGLIRLNMLRQLYNLDPKNYQSKE